MSNDNALSSHSVNSSVYDEDEVNLLPDSTQNSLNCISPQYVNPLVQGFPLLVGTNIITGFAVSSPLSLTMHGVDYFEIGLTTSAVTNQDTYATTAIQA